MTNRTEKKSFWLNLPILVLLMATLITSVTETTRAKPLYVIADMKGYPTPIHVYDIAADGTLTFQAEFSIPHYVRRAEYLAIDSDSNFLFATFEHGDMIHFIDATALMYKNHIAVPDFPDLAGIVYDHDKGLVYCAYRDTDMLYVYDWEASTTTLNPAPHSPATLTGSTAFGIALDEINDLLYVANNSKTINVYYTSGWSLKETITVSRTAISIAVDATRGFIYTGGDNVGNQYLTQYSLDTRREAEVQVEPDVGVMGLAVDPATGFIYVSTGDDYKVGGDNLKVYDTSLKQIGVITDIENPTGIAITFEDISYNPLNLCKNITGSDTNKVGQVGMGDAITFTICFDNESNDYPVNNVSIVDTLPKEVSFITADGDGVFGQYDPIAHTYTWTYTSLSPRSPGDCLQLVALANPDTAPGMTITNSVTIDSDETGSATTSVDFSIYKRPPEAHAGLDQTVMVGTKVSLDGSGSSDPDDDIVSYDWYEGSTFLGSGKIIKYTFPLGNHKVRLVVTDSFGQTDSDEATVTVVTHFQEYFTEQFSSDADSFDLSNKAIMFTPAADSTSYSVCLQEITKLPTDPNGSTRIALFDDSSEFVSLNGQRTVSIFGSSFPGFYVGSNGYITFTAEDREFRDILSFHFALKRISVLFTDLNPILGGVVSWKQLADSAVVTWQDIPMYGTTSSNTFQVQMYFDGRIQLAWLAVATDTGIVGLSEGLGVPTDFQEIDFSKYPRCEPVLPLPVPPAITTVAHWTMDDNVANTTVLDSSGRGNHGTAQRNTSALSVAGMIDSALAFDGISDYISVSDGAEWTFSGDFAITLWVKFNRFNPKWWEAAFIGHDEGPGHTNKWIFSYDPVDSKTLFHINHAGTSGPFIKGNQWAAQAGAWYFIAVTRSGSTYTFYREGISDGAQSDGTAIPDVATPLTIGWAEEYATFDGALDDVRIYNRALSAAEITALYDERFGP